MNAAIGRTLGLAATFLAAGCAGLGQPGARSSLRDAGGLAAAGTFAGVPASDAAWPADDWWRAFGDPQLDRLMAEALAGSPTLRAAEARTRAALAVADAGKAALYPQVNGAASSTRERFAEHGTTPPPVAGTWNTIHQVQASLSWELDFWGRSRAAYESALGAARAAEVDARAARVALTTGIAQAYARLERAFLQLDVARKALDAREHVYALTRERSAAGIDSRIELRQAEAAIPAARERIARLEETIALTRNQIAALMGEGSDRGLAIARPKADGLATLTLPSTLPAELLGRRPDLVARRWRVEALRHGIDAAKAAFYPNVNLVGLVGLQSLGAAGLFTAASRTLAAGPAVTLPIFEGGKLRANLAGKRAEYDDAVEQYNQALAEALREVADQVASFRSVRSQRTEESRAIGAAREAYELALLRYREGVGNYLQVLSAEAPLLEQESLEADLRSRELAISINLVRALGGGFRPESEGLAVARASQPGAHDHDLP